jgi:hypothetical protein
MTNEMILKTTTPRVAGAGRVAAVERSRCLSDFAQKEPPLSFFLIDRSRFVIGVVEEEEHVGGDLVGERVDQVILSRRRPCRLLCCSSRP